MNTCTYRKISEDGYGANWITDCGHEVRMEADIEVGMCPNPLPNEDGKYCSYCGQKILIK